MASTGDRYEILEELGSGGMAAVYRARDRSLNRDVALKILHAEAAEHPAIVARMFREARVIAALDHPGILKLYDVVEALPSPYLVMELLHGKTFQEKLKDHAWPLRRRIAVLEQVARAVDHAHQHGVVHRDLKPSNVMIEEATSNERPATRSGPGTQDQRPGPPRVVVMDFGLAHIENSQSRLTRSGASMGTPYYMAPEQVRGDKKLIRAATDVWALGVILYEALAGRPPFTAGTALEVYDAILRSEPGPLPNVPRDLAVVCFKALEKEPLRRYPSARAFADDLARHLAGEAVAAKPPSTLSRLARRLGRRRGLLIVSAAALLLIAASASLWTLLRMSTSRSSSVQEALLQEMRATSETCLAAALDLRRAGNLEAMRKHADKVDEICRRVIAEMPGLAEPHFIRGRMLRAELRFDDALAEQEAALAIDASHAASRYERVIALAISYRRRMQELKEAALRQGGTGAAARPMVAAPHPQELEAGDAEVRGLRQRMEEDLEWLQGGPGDISVAQVECARGLLAWSLRMSDPARLHLGAALQCSQDLEEAIEALATLETEEDRYESAVAVWTAGLERDRGYHPYHEGRGETRLLWGRYLSQRGGEPEVHFASAVRDLDQAIRLAPLREQLFSKRGLVRAHWGIHRSGQGVNPDDLYRTALEDLTQAIRLNTHRADSFASRAFLYGTRAVDKSGRGEDPIADFESAIADLDRALELDPQHGETWITRGMARANLGLCLLDGGRNPKELLPQAVDDFSRALQLDPRHGEAWSWRGLSRSNWATLKAKQGEDPEPLFSECVRDHQEAVVLLPGFDVAWMQSGVTRTNWATFRMERGRDPGPLFESAIRDLTRAVEINPSRDEAWKVRGTARANWGNWKRDRREDPVMLYEAAREDYARAIAINPKRDESWTRRGNLHQNWGYHERRSGRDPQGLYESAIADFSEALKVNRSRDETWMKLGGTRCNIAMYRIAAGEDPAVACAAAIADLDEALRLNPGRAEAWFRRGLIRGNLGLYRMEHGVDPEDQYDGAESDMNRAIELNRSHAEAWQWRGNIRNNRAVHRLSRNLSAAPGFKAALEDYLKALQLNPALEAEIEPLATRARRYLETHPDE